MEMKNNGRLKILLYHIPILCYVFLWNDIIGTNNMDDLYAGLGLNPDEYILYFTNLLMFMIYIFFFFSRFESYINGEGIYKLVRNKKKWSLIIKLFGEISIVVVYLEAFKNLSYAVLNLIKTGEVKLEDPSEYFQSILIYILVIISFLLGQMMIEVIGSSKIALIAMPALYQGMLISGDLLYLNYEGGIRYLPLLSNFAMYVRRMEIGIGSVEIACVLIAVIIILLGSTILIFQRKDII